MAKRIGSRTGSAIRVNRHGQPSATDIFLSLLTCLPVFFCAGLRCLPTGSPGERRGLLLDRPDGELIAGAHILQQVADGGSDAVPGHHLLVDDAITDDAAGGENQFHGDAFQRSWRIRKFRHSGSSFAQVTLASVIISFHLSIQEPRSAYRVKIFFTSSRNSW